MVPLLGGRENRETGFNGESFDLGRRRHSGDEWWGRLYSLAPLTCTSKNGKNGKLSLMHILPQQKYILFRDYIQ